MKTMIGSNQSADQLRSIVERIEKLSEEKEAIAADIRDVYAEAAGNGYDRTAIRQIIKLRKLEAHVREEQETILETYMRALNMTPQFEDDADAA
jgi:uncharacterized protein (UPF0335 family)